MSLENLMNLGAPDMGPMLTGGLIAGIAIIIAVIAIGLYVYHALVWQTIAKRQKHKRPWLAWIPFANISQILQLGKFGWGWVFLVLIPVVGWIAIIVLLTISMWRIFEKEKYPAWLSLSYALALVSSLFVIAYFVIIGIIAWAKPNKKKK